MSSSKPVHESRRALVFARRYVRFGIRSTQELRTYLSRRGVTGRVVDRVVATCARDGLLDDRACAKLWARHLADRGYAWDAIKEALLAKGLAAPLVVQVLTPFRVDEDDATRARLLVETRLRRRGKPPRNRVARGTAVQRAVARFLAQRGFDSELIDRVLTESFGPTSI